MVKRIGKSAGLETPKAPRAGQKMVSPVADNAGPASPDAVKINVEDTDAKKEVSFSTRTEENDRRKTGVRNFHLHFIF